MTKEDIILLAIEHTINGLKFDEDGLVRFANLVAQHEREACAKACYEEASKHPIGLDSWWATTHCAQAIEARGKV